MWSHLLTAAGSAAVSVVAVLWLGHRMHGRLFDRLRGVRATLEAVRDLENRRVGTELGREHLVRAKAGGPARITQGFVTRPGSLARAARDEHPTNRLGVDTPSAVPYGVSRPADRPPEQIEKD